MDGEDPPYRGNQIVLSWLHFWQVTHQVVQYRTFWAQYEAEVRHLGYFRWHVLNAKGVNAAAQAAGNCRKKPVACWPTMLQK